MSNNITVTISNQPLMDKITQLQQEIITLEETVTSLNAQIADLNQQVEQKQATIDSLNTQISQLQEQISQLDAQVTALTEQVQTLILENSQLTQQVESLTTENTQLTQQVESLTTENSQLTEQVQSLTSQVSQLTEQVQQLQASVESLNGQITSMTNQINTINGETVQNPIEYLSGTKSQILQALQSKGSSATASTTFRNYANEINNLPTPRTGDVYTALLLHFDNSTQFNDSSIYNRPIGIYGNPTISTVESKFGNGSLYLDGSSCLYVNQTHFAPLTSSFTIEFFYYPSSSYVEGTEYGFLNYVYRYYMYAWYTKTFRLSKTSNGMTLTFNSPSKSQVSPIAYNAPITLSSGQWHHIALVRNPVDPDKLYMRVYVDGVYVSWTGLTSNSAINMDGNYWGSLFDVPAYFYLFGINSTDYQTINKYLPGYINELRFSTTCRYTGNFTPPTEPFTI